MRKAPDKRNQSHVDTCCDPREEPSGGVFGEKTELILAIAAGVFVGAGWVLGTFFDPPRWTPMSLYLGAYVFGGFFAFRESWDSLLDGRFNIDFLMLVAAAGAAVLGEWFEGALLLFLFSLGHALEHYAMGHARRAIEALADLAPDAARVRRDGMEQEVPVDDLQVGDTVIVRTNERVPADGFVATGASEVNQAPVTGESIPVEKAPVADSASALDNPNGIGPEHRVFAGTINGSGSLEIIVTKLSTESTLARVVELVREAEIQRSPTQRFADRFERVFVPLVLSLVVLLLFAWLVINEPFTASFYRAMAVLVAASPCALAIATPSAVLSGIARAGRGGVLVKGGGPLENLGSLTALAFDKTGTLTEGTPRVTDVIASQQDDVFNADRWDTETLTQEKRGTSTQALLDTAVAVESLSDHPLAKAIVRYAGKTGHPTNGSGDVARNLENLTGRGIRASVNGDSVIIGKDDLFDEVGGAPPPDFIRDTVAKLEERGRTTMVVRRGNRYLGVIGVMDKPRPSARETLKYLRTLGVRRMIMLSGDNQRVVDAVAAQVEELDEARGDLLPEDKVERVQELSDESTVAMVGDRKSVV